MAKISRVSQKQFGSSGPIGDFGKFGSLQIGSPTFTKDPALIQSLSNFSDGLGAAIVAGYRPALEDMNSLFLLTFYQIAYMFQSGIPEWETGTSYFIGSLVQIDGVIYISKTNDNSANDPTTSVTNWTKGIGGANGAVPPGTILTFGGDSVSTPEGYLYCDGSTVSRTTYTSLFSIISTKYGAGNGSTTFHLPNGKGKILIGADGSSDFLTIGQTGGEKTHTLTTAEMPSHTHDYTRHNVVGGSTGGESDRAKGIGTYTTDPTGGGGAHNNLQPYLVIGGAIIKT